MKIVTIPHPVLRQEAKPVVDPNDRQFRKFLATMKQTLLQTTNPKGVGLAGPQVDALYRVFLTAVQDANQDEPATSEPRVFMNPVIVNHGKNQVLGPDPDSPRLEGCLSMPTLYGPVPRWEWVEVEYQSFHNDELVEKKERFDGFHARVVQHEIDHLDGILFTDYSLELGLPVYQEEGKELVEITDRTALELY